MANNETLTTITDPTLSQSCRECCWAECDAETTKIVWDLPAGDQYRVCDKHLDEMIKHVESIY